MPPRKGQVQGPAGDVVLDGDEALTILQFSAPDPLPDLDIDAFVASLFLTCVKHPGSKLTKDAAYTLWLGTDYPDIEGHTSWLAIAAPAGTGLLLRMHAALGDAGCKVKRESARVAPAGLTPVLRARPKAIDLPLRAPDSVEEVCAGWRIARVPFRVSLAASWKRDLLTRALVGETTTPLLALPYYRDDPRAELVLGSLDLQMFMRLPDATVVAAARPSETPPVVLTFELSPTRTLELLELVQPDAREAVSASLMAPKPFKVPPGTCVVGLRATVESDHLGNRSYIVQSLLPPDVSRLEAVF